MLRLTISCPTAGALGTGGKQKKASRERMVEGRPGGNATFSNSRRVWKAQTHLWKLPYVARLEEQTQTNDRENNRKDSRGEILYFHIISVKRTLSSKRALRGGRGGGGGEEEEFSGSVR